MKIYGNVNFSMLKIIIIILGYTPNNMIVDDGKMYNFKVKKRLHILKKKIVFVNVKTDPRLW
jgi:hypothetical protein